MAFITFRVGLLTRNPDYFSLTFSLSLQSHRSCFQISLTIRCFCFKTEYLCYICDPPGFKQYIATTTTTIAYKSYGWTASSAANTNCKSSCQRYFIFRKRNDRLTFFFSCHPFFDVSVIVVCWDTWYTQRNFYE